MRNKSRPPRNSTDEEHPSTDSPTEHNKMSAQDKIRLFMSVFKGRDDVYGADEGRCVRKPLTEKVILKHVQGKRRIGVYPLLRDSTVHFAVVDIDERNLDAVEAYLDSAHSYGIPTHVEASKSKGFHLWHFFAEPVPAAKVRGLIKQIILDADLSIKTEIFPKQSQLFTPESVGNYINAPLFGKDVANGRTVFLVGGFQPCTDHWGFLANVEKITRSQLEEVMELNGIQDDIATPEISTEEKATSKDYSDMLPCVARMMAGVSEGCRDEVAFCLAKHWRAEKNLSEEDTLAILLRWNQKNHPPLDGKTIQAKVKSAYEGRGGKGYTSFGCDNDMIRPFCDREDCPIFKKHQKAAREVDTPYFKGKTFIPPRLGNELMNDYSFIYAGEQLYVYTDGVYTPIGEEFVRLKCRERLQEDARINRINEVIAHIEDLSRVKNDQLNTRKELINLENGMLNWQTGELLPHSEEYLSTTRIPVKYNPAAECPKINRFLETTLPEDCIDLAHELSGYCLIPDTRFHKSFMLVGGGNNGKSTLLTLLERSVGTENVSKVPIQELCDNRFKRADLYGKLVNLFADLDDKALQSTTYFKTIVSGDPIDAERKNRDPFYFRPFARLVYSANEIPRSRDRSHAYYRRWCIIRFPNQFSGETEIKGLAGKLIEPEELSGLLNHALAGLRRLFENQAFSESESVKQELEDYRKANDTVLAFIGDRCVLDDEGVTERTRLYDAYLKYCREEGYKPVSRNACYNRIRAQRVSEPKVDGIFHFAGIRLKEIGLDNSGQNSG